VAETPTPRQIHDTLARRVVGQEEAVKEMSIALAKKLAGVRVGHILMIGSSGTGKTTVMRSVEEYLTEHPKLAVRSTVVRMHANVLGEEAERGRPGEAVLWRLLDRARQQLGTEAPVEEMIERAGQGLIFVDEVDKIRSHIGDRPNVSGIRAQEALLTLIENEAVPVELPPWAGGGSITIDSSGLLFVCAGAFEGLHDSVFDRVTVGKDRGMLQSVTTMEAGKVKEEVRFHLRDWLRNEDLFDYGMSPQFLSRFDAVVLLNDLQVDQLVKIFLEAPESGYQLTKEYLATCDVHLALSPAAARRIAEEAAQHPRLGARALKEVFRRVVRDYEFDPDSASEGGTLIIDLPEVEAALERY